VLEYISKKTGVPRSQIFGVATFYAQFYLTRPADVTSSVSADGTACHVRGAAKIVTKIEEELGISRGNTTPDYKATFEVVYCLGSCGLAPVAVVDDRVVGNLVPEKMLNIRARAAVARGTVTCGELSLHILDILQNSVEAGASLVELTIEEDLQADTMTIAVKDDGRAWMQRRSPG